MLRNTSQDNLQKGFFLNESFYLPLVHQGSKEPHLRWWEWEWGMGWAETKYSAMIQNRKYPKMTTACYEILMPGANHTLHFKQNMPLS